MIDRPAIYGLLAEFETPDALVNAARSAYESGYRRLDSFSPMPIDGLAEVMGATRTWVPLIVLLGGIIGGVGGYSMMYYASAIAYPINVGGRPLHSVPAFIPITFELTVLGAALAAVLGMLWLNGLPTPYHPLFNVPEFDRVTRDRFFLCIEARDPAFDREQTHEFLNQLAPRAVFEVPY